MAITYILYSKKLKRYYTGSTRRKMHERLELHLEDHHGFTSKAKDWILVYYKELHTITEAMQLERKIKKRGARRYLEGITQ